MIGLTLVINGGLQMVAGIHPGFAIIGLGIGFATLAIGYYVE